MENFLMDQAITWKGMPTADGTRQTLQRAKFFDRLVTAVMWFVAGLLALVLFGVIFILLYKGLAGINWSFLTTSGSLTEDGAGIGPQIFVSFYILCLSLLFIIPLGLGAAIYLAEYANPGFLTTAVRFCTEALSAVPSVVFGIFGSIVFLTVMGLGYSVLSGALTLTLLNLPLMVRIAEDAIRNVPRAYREGSLALGATKWETIRKVVLPTALPGIVTAIILTGGRIIGETAPLILTTGTTISPNAEFSLNPLQTGETLAVHIWVLKIIGLPGVENVQQIADATAAVLLLLVLLINLGATYFTWRLQRKLKGVA